MEALPASDQSFSDDSAKNKRLDEFRIFYNHTIFPELVRMERLRLRLLRLLLVASLLMFGILIFQFYVNLAVLTLLMAIPIALAIGYLLYRIQEFRQTFKPHVVNLITDFIDDGLNFDPQTPLKYDPKRKIEKSVFLSSRLFVTDARFYEGEDFIEGKIGEMPFELSELDVRENSPVSSGLKEVFRGVFLHATFPEENTEGEILVWPRHRRQYLSRSIKDFTFDGGKNVDKEVLNLSFRSQFLTYADEDTHVISILSEPMQDSIVQFVEKTGKDIYLSFQDRDIFVAVTEDKDLLEPYLFRSNLSFELIFEFFESIHVVLRIAEEFDQTH
ncbi:MAG TPA: DUF3137 domain-containing protein [Saprospiraceae bacterium]|nr:DUF3137 domain-containing protein [Saprospiraceae bacterium]HMQ83641.1 DUF3137 domain-containing protein [Saprospiraceae bacterium]